MNLYVLICVAACAISSASSASVRYRRQAWPKPFPDHFHFPGDPFPAGRDDFNTVIDFPGGPGRPGDRIDFRPTANNRPSQATTPSSTIAWSSTPRTYHLAPEGCNCPFTPQFNPVCGSDGNTYKNAGLLKCFVRCGIDVSQRRMGAC